MKFLGMNWKNYLFWKEAKDILSRFDPPHRLEVVVFPPFPLVGLCVRDFPRFHYGAQDVSPFGLGAYTGEAPAPVLREIGVEWVLIGHSERRNLFSEGEEVLRKKVQRALEADLNIVFCVGEPLPVRNEGKTLEYVEKQLEILDENWRKKLLVAYEPLWAIGTGRTPTVLEVKETVEGIRSLGFPKVVYGGSVKSSNVQELLDSGCDGFLVGSASANLEEIATIAEVMGE